MEFLETLSYFSNQEIAALLAVYGIRLTVCHQCAGALPTYIRGRPRKYCSRSCQMKAYRDRRQSRVSVMRRAGLGEAVRLRWKDYRTPFPWEAQPLGPSRDTVDALRWLE
jgi:hypothetical protein